MTPSSSPTSAPLRVRSIPAGHDYVRHAVGLASDTTSGATGPTTDPDSGPAGIVVLSDPVLDPAEPSRWWPHPALEAADRPEVLDGADLVHVHFGYEHRSPAQVEEFVTAVRARGLPLVVTVHDLTNPHEADAAAHLDRTGHLVRGADAVVTLTAGAADEIRRRWGVDPQVIPHPRLMPVGATEPYRLNRLERAGHPGRADQAGRHAGPHAARPPERRAVGVVLGSLRAGVAAEGLLPQLANALPAGADLVVMVRSDALAAAHAPGHARHEAALALDALAERPEVEVRSHDLLTDDELCRALAGFDALVLPHRHGTHSGWLELCRDLGLPPVIPHVGYMVEQWGSPAGSYNPSDPTAADLRRALTTALGGPPVPARLADAEDSAVAAAHAALYRAARVAVASHRGVGSDHVSPGD